MSAVVATIICFVLYGLGYRFYSGFLAKRIFRLDADRVTPAHAQRDDIDYIPTNRFVLFGHHYASITGLAPMLGPAVAVIWGWVPAMLWIVFGAIFVGCVHDFSALVLSMRARGLSIGRVAEGVIGRRAKFLFLALIFFGIALAMGVFVYIISILFQAGPDFDPSNLAAARTSFPSAALPSGALMILAMVLGVLLYKFNFPLGPTTCVGFVLLLFFVWLGMQYPTLGLPKESWPARTGWMWILLAYAALASVLPVWSLLQARDFLNSLLLYVGLLSAYIGFFILRPPFSAPAFDAHPEGAPPAFPFVFIVIACGAASGFHGLVSSGTTAKQMNRETDARFVGYGAMVGESLLGLLAVLACTAGIETSDAWHLAYKDWATIQFDLAHKLGVFIVGTGRFIEALGVSKNLAAGFIAVIVVSFALTTLDSATRLLRFNVSEIGSSLGLRIFENRFIATSVAIAAIWFFARYEIDGKAAGLVLWTLFGMTNQLLAGLTLLVATLYLYQRNRAIVYTALPAVFILVSTFTAIIQKLLGFWRSSQWLLLGVGGALLAVGVLIIVECVRAFCKKKTTEDENVFFE